VGTPRPRASFVLAFAAFAAGFSGCNCSSSKDAGDTTAPQPSGTTNPTASTNAAAPPGSAAALGPSAAPLSPSARVGGAIGKNPKGDTLFVADEDHKTLRILRLPLDPAAAVQAVSLPGAPAEVVAIDGAVLVTIRDPGLLLTLKPDASGAFVETNRVSVPADAWGLSVTPDVKVAYVSSAWTHKVSKVDLETGKLVWSTDVPREPRGIVALANGELWVNHLVGPDVTRIHEAKGAPVVESVSVLPSPVRAPSGKKLHASLGYSLVTNPKEERLFLARHAVGALARRSWFGQPTVDVVLLPGVSGRTAPEQLAATHVGGLPATKSHVADLTMTPDTPVNIPGRDKGPFTQPRAMVYRAKSDTLLVAGEGDDVVAELDAIALDPTLAIVRIFQVGQKYDAGYGAATECGAPSGLTLSSDEDTAYVYCRTTNDVVSLDLSPAPTAEVNVKDRRALVHFEGDVGSEEMQKGRKLFYNATDPIVSGGLGCAGCHPDGRDDGHIWHEATFDTVDGLHTNFVGAYENVPDLARTKGVPRRTPMLSGNVSAAGPFGWHGESPDLAARLSAGMGLHRWGGMPQNIGGAAAGRASLIAAFVREGIVPPPREERPLDEKEKRGKEVFNSETTKCARCHVPETGYTDRTAYPLRKLPQVSGFEEETNPNFKTPSLRYVGGRGPYFHDGRASTLEKLVETNGDRMGNTANLSPEDREALVAFLKTL